MPITLSHIHELLSLQLALVDGLAACLGVPRGRVWPAVAGAASGTLLARGCAWTWRHHGEGVAFRSEDGQRLVDAHVRPGDPTLVDAWRLLRCLDPSTGARLTEDQVHAELLRLQGRGDLARVDVSPQPHPRALFRPSDLHPKPDGPLLSTGEAGGGWIELQLGPHRNTPWKQDSLYLDARGSECLDPALQAAIPDFDSYGTYVDVDAATLTRLAEALREQARTFRSGERDPRQGSECIQDWFRDMAREPAQRLAADASDNLADWLFTSLATHEVISILGP